MTFPERKELTSFPQSEFITLLEKQWVNNKFLCVGLDTVIEKIPEAFKKGAAHEGEIIFNFNVGIIDATHHVASVYKPNSAFYEAYGPVGIAALIKTVNYIHRNYPDKLVILDAKRGDIADTNKGYIVSAFNQINADAITLNPYIGRLGLQSFLDNKDKGCIFLVKTSNPGADEFQNLPIGPEKIPVWQVVAKHVVDWNENGNCAIVVGSTYPEDLRIARKIVGRMPILAPGLGTQGATPVDLVGSYDDQGWGIIANVSRSVIYPKEIQEREKYFDAVKRTAETWHHKINKYRLEQTNG